MQQKPSPSKYDRGRIRRPGVGRHTFSEDEEDQSDPQINSSSSSNNDHRLAGSSTANTENNSTNNSNNNNSNLYQPESSTSDTDLDDDKFVTQPPRQRDGLTGKISTLFRREASGGMQGRIKTKPLSGGGPSAKDTAHLSGDDDDRSRMSRDISIASSVASSHSKRIFFSSHDGDSDSEEDSFSRKSSASARSLQQRLASGTTEDTDDTYSRHTGSLGSYVSHAKTIVRYRGFSTSIKSLFLDETVVCASMGCFGLILSNRTEYLLHLRNERRGALLSMSPRRGSSRTGGSSLQQPIAKKLPSRIVAYALLATIFLMFGTFIVWGFGTGNGLANDYYQGYYNNDMMGDDEAQDYYNGNNYNGGYNNDDGNNAYNDDLAAQDQAEYEYNNQADQDQNQNQYNNYNQQNYYNQNAMYNNQQNYDEAANVDDQYANANADDGGIQNDDQNNNINEGDDVEQYYAYEGDDGRRLGWQLEGIPGIPEPRPRYHVFTLRDYQEHLWNPIAEFIIDEWNRGTPTQQLPSNSEQQRSHERKAEEEQNGSYGDDEYDSYNYNQEELAIGNRDQNIASNVRVALLFTFLLFLGVMGRRRRMRTRFYLVRARAQEDHLYYAGTEVGETKHIDNSREDQYEGACSHTLCGCYPVDEVSEESPEQDQVEVTDHGVFKRKSSRQNEDSVARCFGCLMSLCCGYICKCWFQCLSVCALAQEAREIRLLVPPRYQRIDFITHQPFHEYQKDVNDLRRGWLGKSRKKYGIKPHLNALSRLSRYILGVFLFLTVALVATLVLNPRAAFSWHDAVVLIATFAQSFAVLFVIHWIFHKSDLSLDAVIKFFAAGFAIAVPSAFFLEGFFVNSTLLFTFGLYELCAVIVGEAFELLVAENWLILWIIGELFNAYVVAAATEELCKYYTFRSVEHPDLIFLTGLTRENQDEQTVSGGVVKYPFGSHQVEELNRERSLGDTSHYSHRSNKSNRSKSKNKTALIERTGTTDEEYNEDDKDVRTHRQKAMAITTAMISVAVGLACAENMLYVFVLGGVKQVKDEDSELYRNDIMEEWVILFFRSIFPIHALAAALQSINMIRKFVEGSTDHGHRIGVGRIILPAVLVHGSFDAVLMGINVYQEHAWEQYLAENSGNIKEGDPGPFNTIVVNLVAWAGITLVLLAGLAYYYRENRNQYYRLKILDEQDILRRAGTQSWNTPAMQMQTNVV